MKIIETTIYRCDFCKKIYLKRYWAAKHELKCKKNPANDRPCFHCEHLIFKWVEICIDYCKADDADEMRNLFFCNKKEVYLYPPQVEFKDNAFDLGDDTNEPMPIECDVAE